MNDVIEALPTLHRWLRGERVGPLPVRGAEHAPPQLSFEFFPPRTEALEQQLWSCIRAAGAVGAAFRVGHLRRRRHHTGPHARHRGAAGAGNQARPRRASHLRWRDTGRSGCRRP